MSGAGKSSTLKMLEDAGYFCVDNLPVPLIMCLKIRGPVADVTSALDAAEAAAKSITGVVTKHMNSSADPETEKMLKISAI